MVRDSLEKKTTSALPTLLLPPRTPKRQTLSFSPLPSCHLERKRERERERYETFLMDEIGSKWERVGGGGGGEENGQIISQSKVGFYYIGYDVLPSPRGKLWRDLFFFFFACV